jgi:hypothetical protein
MIYSAREYNAKQKSGYLEYCDKCKDNNITPTQQNRYFQPLSVNYGFVVETQCNGLVWKKNKKDFK